MYSIAVTILTVTFYELCSAFQRSDPTACNIICPPTDTQCAFDLETQEYKLFSSGCAMAAHARCHGRNFVQTPLKYCIKQARRSAEDTCPVFCPNYYSPVCGASKYRSYKYRTFNNGCYLDMINCRGDEDYSVYIEVPLEFCQNHLMKNIFQERVVTSHIHDYEDYDQI